MRQVRLQDESSWPDPSCEEFKDLSWSLRHGVRLTREQLLFTASILDAYAGLILHPAFTLKVVQEKVSNIRKVIKSEGPNQWDSGRE
jgi:hypothetical protein